MHQKAQGHQRGIGRNLLRWLMMSSAGLRNISPDASADFLKEADGRRKIMELEVRNALHIIKCLGSISSDAQCGAESAAIAQEKASLENEYAQTHAVFDGKWISLPVTSISPAPKKNDDHARNISAAEMKMIGLYVIRTKG